MVENLGVSDQLFAATMDVVSEGVVVRDREGRLVECNELAWRLLGLTREQLESPEISGDWQRRLARRPEQSPVDAPEATTLKTGEAVRAVPVRWVRPDGVVRWLELSSVALRAPGGALAGAVTGIRDVTEEQRQRERAEVNERRLEALMQDLDHGGFEHDFVTGLTAWSLRVFDLLGRSRGGTGLGATDWFELVHPDDVGEAQQAWERVRSGRTTALDHEYRVRHRDGHWLWLRIVARVVRTNERGEPQRVSGEMQDVTQRRELEDLLKAERSRTRQLEAEVLRLQRDEGGRSPTPLGQTGERVG